MASGPSVSANLMESERLINIAVERGAKIVVLPENFSFMGMAENEKLRVAEVDGAGLVQDFLSAQASKHGIFLIGGTIPLSTKSPKHIRAACLVYDSSGERVARYDKMHLFDVNLEESNEQYAESETIEPGDEVCCVDTPYGRLGLAVCYDLRFPEQFRQMAESGIDIIVLPSAFTAITGKAHWQHLVCARAIENLCYLIAPNQGGYHVSGRESYGHSMVIDPWGGIVDSLDSGAGVVVAEIDRDVIDRVRKNFPVLEHRRLGCRSPF
ncbi:MAG: carbon-nitrogen hydrolase family protein [Gammaproteobacteria bacterium]|nr:carbon-nitrogen hydrolase family protein [Gammaproteobacteria bacterium]